MATDGLQPLPHASLQGASSNPDPFSPRAYQDSAVEKEIKQRAATALHDHSVLLLHALSMNETPTKARLRMYRHLTGQPQPPHEHTPAAQRKQKDVASSEQSHGSSATSASTGLFNPLASSSSASSFIPVSASSTTTGAGSSRIGALGGSSIAFGSSGSSGGGGHAPSLRTTSTTTGTATTRHSSVPVDEEFGHTYFQGPLSS
ncbi:unnamed protein product [Mortierella alpina]